MMKSSRKTFMITSIVLMAAIWGFIALERASYLKDGLDLIIFILIILIGVMALFNAIKKDKEEQAGLATEDELSTKIKYKAGYHAYMISMYMWLFIFLFRDKIPDIETMLGGGILLSAVIALVSKIVIKSNFSE